MTDMNAVPTVGAKVAAALAQLGLYGAERPAQQAAIYLVQEIFKLPEEVLGARFGFGWWTAEEWPHARDLEPHLGCAVDDAVPQTVALGAVADLLGASPLCVGADEWARHLARTHYCGVKQGHPWEEGADAVIHNNKLAGASAVAVYEVMGAAYSVLVSRGLFVSERVWLSRPEGR